MSAPQPADERNVDRHDLAGYAAWLRERAKANRDIAMLPREEWPYRPAVLQHWAFRFDQGAELIERLERALTETHDAWTAETTKRLQAERELAEVRAELGTLQPWRTDDVGGGT